MNPGRLLEIAVAAARASGDHALTHQARRRETLSRSPRDIKLVLDRECQTVAESVICEAIPDACILGEEGNRGEKRDTEWIVDPIDGTANFYRHLPWWCSSVAVRSGDTVVAGAVYAPEFGRLYAASVDHPATLNGQPIQVSPVTSMAETFITTGISKTSVDAARSMAVTLQLQPEVMKLRIMGAAALDLCMVAEGVVDGFYETGIYIWDVAAACLIVERAGGKTITQNHQPDGRLTCIAGTGLTFPRLRELAHQTH